MPFKAKSKSQFKLFKGIESGSIAPKGGLTPETAGEMTGGQSPKGLPERKKPAKKKGKRPAPIPYGKK